MSGIVLSSAVRQNLLSLSSTAELLATTQNRLATGKKVNSALDNPTNFFTASGLDNRASDINNLLDGIGNGVQILQAANTGITSLQKLVDSAKSIANQALQSTVGYSTKANVVSGAITANGGAVTASDLRGKGTVVDNAVTGSAVGAITGASLLSVAAIGLANNDAISINGKTITFDTSTVSTLKSVTDASGNYTFYTNAGGANPTVTDLLAAVDTLSGNTLVGATASNVTGAFKLNLHTGTSNDLTLSDVNGGNALSKFGLTAGTTQRTGEVLTITATGGGLGSTITFGDGTGGTVKSLNDLNNALAGNNLTASLDTSGKLTIQTNNDYASYSLGTIGGTTTSDAAGAFKASNGSVTTTAPIKDAVAFAARAAFVTQYNGVLDQITNTASDSSFNGVNLLNGDTLKLVFNETGKSTLTITGVNFGPGGLGLGKLVSGTDFVDNAATNKVLTTLNAASTTLRSQASTFGSNLSVVQSRQDFSKNLINVLQTGSSNLTIADTNEEAANSQALSTRQSIAVSALSLANQSQQAVLQLLR